MYNTAIIGAGQLGSRHLQGLKTSSLPMEIWVIDNNNESLKIAEDRYNAVEAVSSKSAHFINDIHGLPTELDFVVVATGSKPRAAIVKSLLSHSTVKNLILEKVLFPKLSEYDEIGNLLKSKGVKCWVNCPRRMFGYFQDVKGMLDLSKPITMKNDGKDWGLCCNAMHMIDIFLYLTGEDAYALDTTRLIPEVIESKRNGYIEINGVLEATTPKGSKLTLVCSPDFEGEAKLAIENNGKNIVIYEGKGTMYVNEYSYSFHLPYQSEMTGLLADMILKTGFCPLTTYEKSAAYHKTFIKAILDYYNKVQGTHSDLCPIT